MPSERALRGVAHGRGYEYRGELPADVLTFTDPPWSVSHGSSGASSVLRSLHKETEHARLLAGDFRLGSGEDSWTQTFCAAVLRRPPPDLDAWIARQVLPPGLHCVRRGDCVYLYPDVYSGRRPWKLKARDVAACLDALEALSLGHLGVASYRLRSIAPTPLWGSMRWLVWLAAAAMWIVWGYHLLTAEQNHTAVLIVGVLLLAFNATVFWINQWFYGAARSYAEKQTY